MDTKFDSKADIDGVDDGPIKNVLVSILDTLTNMDTKMTDMDSKMNLVISNLSTLNEKVDDHSKSFGRIEKQLGIVFYYRDTRL